MLRIAISFTITLRNVHENEISLEDIDELHVGCHREHLFPEDTARVPMEVSWLNSSPGFKCWHGEGGVTSISRTLCDQKALSTWEDFSKWLLQKDAEGKVKYVVGNYPELVKRLQADGHKVWYHGEWQS